MIDGVQFLICSYVRRRYPTDPVRRTFPGAYRILIVNTDGSVSFDNPSAAFRRLPFQSHTSQAFICCPWPDKSPKLLIASCALAFLNAQSHLLQFGPGLRWDVIPVLRQQVSTVIKHTDMGMIRNCNNSALYRIA